MDVERSRINKELLLLLDGLFQATLFDYLKSKATFLLDEFLAYSMLLCVKFRKNMRSADESSEMIPCTDIDLPSAVEFRHFGCLQVDGILSQSFNILIMNDLFTRILSQGEREACESALRKIVEIKALY
jgi:hypothetical protein